ncbi:MAG: hypothetical protein HY471_00485 [Candidatus Sungbacteria bacterium]|nr:hypothetical protein [Candidatus Sungbacteria bacterium]
MQTIVGGACLGTLAGGLFALEVLRVGWVGITVECVVTLALLVTAAIMLKGEESYRVNPAWVFVPFGIMAAASPLAVYAASREWFLPAAYGIVVASVLSQVLGWRALGELLLDEDLKRYGAKGSFIDQSFIWTVGFASASWRKRLEATAAIAALPALTYLLPADEPTPRAFLISAAATYTLMIAGAVLYAMVETDDIEEWREYNT